jgi:hypothetical protein
MLELADFLENIEQERFNISMWASNLTKSSSGKFLYNPGSEVDINVCNTAGCIAGWAIAYYNNGFAYFPPLNAVNATLNVVRGAEILDLSLEEAKRLFYTDEESVWYRNIVEIPGTEDFLDDVYDGKASIEDYDFESYITSKVAAQFLRKIANGEFTL